MQNQQRISTYATYCIGGKRFGRVFTEMNYPPAIEDIAELTYHLTELWKISENDIIILAITPLTGELNEPNDTTAELH